MILFFNNIKVSGYIKFLIKSVLLEMFKNIPAVIASNDGKYFA